MIVLDTHAWLWLCLEPQRLSAAAVTAIRRSLSDGGLATHFASDFPPDPADRLIAATARAEGLPLVSRDVGMRRAAVVQTIW